jgi:hypothetical protein
VHGPRIAARGPLVDVLERRVDVDRARDDVDEDHVFPLGACERIGERTQASAKREGTTVRQRPEA